MMKSSRNVLVVGLIIVMAVLAGVFLLGNPVSAQKVILSVPSSGEHVLHAYLWLAQEKGFFREEGIDVEVALAENDKDVIEAVSSGTQPIGAIAIEHFLDSPKSIPNIIPFKFFLYGESETSSYDTHLVASKRSGIKTIADLKGKTVRLGQPPTRIAMESILQEAGLTLDDIVIDRTESHHVLGALQDGSVDAAITYYPTMPIILASGDVTILSKNIFANHVMDNVPQTAIGVNKDFAEKNPETVRRFLAAMGKAFNHGEDNPADVILSYVGLKEFGEDSWAIDAELLEKGASLMPRIAIKELDGFYVEDGEKETIFEVLHEYQEVLEREGHVESTTNLQPLMDNYLAFKGS